MTIPLLETEARKSSREFLRGECTPATVQLVSVGARSTVSFSISNSMLTFSA